MANPLLYKKERNTLEKKLFLVGKSLSTLIAATLQHLSACRRCHSLSKSVYFASLSFFRLIRSFHNSSPAFFFSFFTFLFTYRKAPHDNFFNYILNGNPRQAILRRFSAFLPFFTQKCLF